MPAINAATGPMLRLNVMGLFRRLRAQFSEPQIVELTAAIALENFRSKFKPALGVESQGFCLLPKR